MSINPETVHRVRIKNLKSGRYLSIEGDQSNWCRDDASLTIRDWLGGNVIENPQVWNIIHYRDSQWIMLNQFSKALACIRGRSKDDGATVIQYHSQCLIGKNEPFQEWSFTLLENGNYLIKNANSGKYIGPQGRSTENDHYCIQYTDQTSLDSYQEWVFEQI